MAEQCFMEMYGKAKPEQRVDLILNHYQDFPSIIEGQWKILILKIKNEREYMRQLRKEDTGGGPGSGKLPDPTAGEAIETVYMENLIFSGENIHELTHDMRIGEKRSFRRQFYILKKMQEDYTILQTQVLFLTDTEKKIFTLYVENGQDLQKIADQEGIQNDSARKRIWTIRRKIKNGAIYNMSETI